MHHHETSNVLRVSASTPRRQTSLCVCRKCRCQLPDLSGSLATNSTPTGRPLRKPVGTVVASPVYYVIRRTRKHYASVSICCSKVIKLSVLYTFSTQDHRRRCRWCKRKPFDCTTLRHIVSVRCLGHHKASATQTTLCLKKVLTFKLSVTLSNVNRFSKFLHC